MSQQSGFIEILKEEGVRADGLKIGRIDKRSRLAQTGHWIQNGRILFPRHGCEELIKQITAVDFEDSDNDLADAFAVLAVKAMEPDPAMPEIFSV